jgi:hypothetical protein
VEERERQELVDAARGDIPAAYADPLWISASPDGTHAVVVLGINGFPYADVEEADCFREDGRWSCGSSSNGLGSGWTPRACSGDPPQFTGLLRLSGEAPAGVDAVVVGWDGREHELPVTGGYWFFGVWDVPEGFDERSGFPMPVAHVRAGRREPVPRDDGIARSWGFERAHRLEHVRTLRAQVAVEAELDRLRLAHPPTAPATGAEVGEAASALGVMLPSSYWQLATTFAPGAVLYGIEEVVGPRDLGAFSWRYSADADPEEPIPFVGGGATSLRSLVPFHRDDRGNSWCFVSAGRPFAECPVAYFDVAARELRGALDGGLADWLRILSDARRPVIRTLDDAI